MQLQASGFVFGRDYQSAPDLRSLPEVAAALLELSSARVEAARGFRHPKAKRALDCTFPSEDGNALLEACRRSLRPSKLSRKGLESEEPVGTRTVLAVDGRMGTTTGTHNVSLVPPTVNEIHLALIRWLCLKLGTPEPPLSILESANSAKLREISSALVLQWNDQGMNS